VTIVGAVGLAMLLIPRARKFVAPTILTALTAAVALFLIKPEYVQVIGKATRLFGSAATNVTGYSDLERSILANQAMRDFYYSPFHGIGLQVSFDAQTVYLQILQSGGLLLMVSLMFYYLAAIVVSFRTIPENSLAAALCASVVASLVLDVFEADLTDRFYYVPVAGILALQLATRWRSPDGSTETAEPAAQEQPAGLAPPPRAAIGAAR
jgi:O-antigen ligase